MKETARPYEIEEITDAKDLRKHVAEYHEFPLRHRERKNIYIFHEKLHQEDDPIMVDHEHIIFPDPPKTFPGINFLRPRRKERRIDKKPKK